MSDTNNQSDADEREWRIARMSESIPRRFHGHSGSRFASAGKRAADPGARWRKSTFSISNNCRGKDVLARPGRHVNLRGNET
jgi:hypothetical protein